MALALDLDLALALEPAMEMEMEMVAPVVIATGQSLRLPGKSLNQRL